MPTRPTTKKATKATKAAKTTKRVVPATAKAAPAAKRAATTGRGGSRGGGGPSEPPAEAARQQSWAQRGEAITTPNGVPVADTDNSLRAGARGPTLLDDFHLREKVMHFDHERIPERVVHARGAGAYGTFTLYESLEELTCARILTEVGTATPTFVRFSTVAGSKGSADTARDVRGFAVRFYTDEGNWDLVGNNIPVFFIQDGIKFPDLIHAAKPEPDREIPQAQTAHDTFWDFAALAPETTHMLLWAMSDRAIPRSYRTMEGFGVHTFRLVNGAGETTLVKFHWKPVLGVHSLVWEEAQKLGGIDPDFHRRDLWAAIEGGNGPEWELGLQLFPDTEDQMFEGIDLLDPTKLVPEELAPVRRVGRMVLDRNPTNYFAETEQVAFCTAHVVRGIDFTDDPLLQVRNFSYLDTQLTRLGGPNFDQLPVNRPRAPVNTNERDGFGQQAVHEGAVAYSPNSAGGGCPFHLGADGFVDARRQVAGVRGRERPASFADHFSQATLFWNSMAAVERTHIVGAFAFELSHCERPEVRERMVANLGQVNGELADRVAAALGLPAPAPGEIADVGSSAALSQLVTGPGPVVGQVVGIVAGDGADTAGIEGLRSALAGAGATALVLAPHAGNVQGKGGPVAVDKAAFSTQSVEYDALVVAGGTAKAYAGDANLALNLGEAYRHHKTVAAWGDGRKLLEQAGVASGAGVVTAASMGDGFATKLVRALGWHRHWDR